MLFRKINAGISLLCTYLLLNHASLHAIWMLSRGTLPKITTNSYQVVPWVLFGAMMLHAIISIVLAVLGHKGAEKHKCRSYPNLNRPTIIQRASGIALILLTMLHIAGTIGILQPPQLVHAILPPLFFTISLMHTALSTSKAFITLGIGNAAFIKIADIAIKALCIVTLIADITGFYLFLV